MLLGSASLDLIQHSSETLAGRVAFIELGGLHRLEVPNTLWDDLWLRGGFPESLTAPSGVASVRWRRDFTRTYLERDVAQFAPRIAAEMLRRFWTMLGAPAASTVNVAQLARNLGVDTRTAGGYLDLLGITDMDSLLSHPVVGASWEGHVVESLLAVAPQR